MRSKVLFISLLFFCGIVFGQPPEVVLINQPNMQPEGLEYSVATGFITSSGQGTVYKVDDNGALTPFVVSNNLMTTLGLHIDKKRNLLLVVNTNGAAAWGGQQSEFYGSNQLSSYLISNILKVW